VPVLRKLANGFDKPVIFTEIGYRSIRGAATQPWNYEAEGPADSEEQAASYQAFFDAWALHASWMQGAFFWNWPAETTDPAGTDYSPRGKPAELVLAQNFGVTPELQRARRLEEIRRQVQAGEYKVDPLAVSKALVRHHLRSDEPDE
jgi:hypothetical protein